MQQLRTHMHLEACLACKHDDYLNPKVSQSHIGQDDHQSSTEAGIIWSLGQREFQQLFPYNLPQLLYKEDKVCNTPSFVIF